VNSKKKTEVNLFHDLVLFDICNVISFFSTGFIYAINKYKEQWGIQNCKWRIWKIRGPFAKFVDSPYYAESELRGGAVTVSFSKYLPWQAMRFLLRSTHFSKTCCRPLITLKFLASELDFHGWKSPEIAWGEIWTVRRMFWWGSTDPLFPSRTQNSIKISTHAIFGLFQPWKGSSEARNFEVIYGLQHVFEKWVERCKKCIACQRRYFEKETVIAPPQSSDSE
jgi:hypothetical protein